MNNNSKFKSIPRYLMCLVSEYHVRGSMRVREFQMSSEMMGVELGVRSVTSTWWGSILSSTDYPCPPWGNI